MEGQEGENFAVSRTLSGWTRACHYPSLCEQVDDIMKSSDHNSDRLISFDEFLPWYRRMAGNTHHSRASQ